MVTMLNVMLIPGILLDGDFWELLGLAVMDVVLVLIAKFFVYIFS